MTSSAMLYLFFVAVGGSAAATIAEAGLRRLRLPARWVWLGALTLGPLLLLVPRLVAWVPRGAPTAALKVPTRIDALIVAPGSTTGAWLGLADRGLAGAWAIATLVLVLRLLHSHWMLARERRSWKNTTVLGSSVQLSAHRGPAVAGFVRPGIVLPEWVLRLPEDELLMVVLHEEQHIRAGDSRLVAVALNLVALTPWNPLAWWQLRRLRAAMELDCDQRVLASRGDARVYGAALLSVAARMVPDRSLALAAFSEDARSLRARIVAMTTRRSRWAVPGGALLLVLAAAVGVEACNVESPLVPVATLPGAASTVAATPPGVERPRFTPFTVAPKLLNREQASQDLKDEYPTLLRDAGVGGVTLVWIRIDEGGAVMDAQVQKSSGHPALDQAALRVAHKLAFSPAMNRDQKLPVWIAMPITFQP